MLPWQAATQSTVWYVLGFLYFWFRRRLWQQETAGLVEAARLEEQQRLANELFERNTPGAR